MPSMCDVLLEMPSGRWMHHRHKLGHMVSYNVLVVCGIQTILVPSVVICVKKGHTITSSWSIETGWLHTFRFFIPEAGNLPYSDRTIRTLQKKLKHIRLCKIFPIFCCPIFAILRSLILSDRSCTQCGPQLL